MSTSSDAFAGADPTRLQAHLSHCAAARGRLHRLRGLAAAADALVQPRFMCTLATVSLALTALAWVWVAMAA